MNMQTEAVEEDSRGEAWFLENKDAIDAYNEHIDAEGTLITPIGLLP